LASQSPRSSGYSNNLGALRSAGLVEYPAANEVSLTDAGEAVANAPEVPATTEELHERIQAKLSRAQWAILKVLIDRRDEEVDKEDLAAAAGQSPTSSVKVQPILFL
jgi:uncharacterized protein